MPFAMPHRRFIPTLTALTALFVLAGCVADTNEPKSASVENLTHAADQMRAQGDDVGAADLYQRILQHAPDDVAARKSLGEILEAHGDIKNAELEYREAIRGDQDNADLLREHGRVLVKLGRPAEARDEYSKVIAADHHDIKALNGLGVALDFLGQHNTAQQSYQSALDENPDDLTTINNLAHSYVLTGDYNAAIKLLEPHAQDKTATPALRQNLAEAYGLAGMPTDAERMARMDLPPAQVKQNIAYYHSQRIKLGLVPKYVADLGSFGTEALANGHVDTVKAAFPSETAGIILTTIPSVSVSGGTPSFDVRAIGFAQADRLHDFCKKLKKGGLNCKPISNG